MTKRIFVLRDESIRRRVQEHIWNVPDGYQVTVTEPPRTLDQNSAQWPILEQFSRQLQWPVNGSMVTMTPEEWKDVMTAAYKRETVRVAMGLDGGMVMLGSRTSKFKKREFSEYLEFLHATAALRGVDLSYRDAA